MSCYTANAINMVPEMDNVNNKESYGMFESFLSNNSFSNISKETLELEVVGPTAYELGFYEDMIKPKNSDPYHRKLRYSAIWKKEPDGNWRWHRFIFNNLPLE